MTLPNIIDTITFQCHPIIFGLHYLSRHYVPTGMCTTDPFMNLMYNLFGLVSIDTPQKYLVFAFLVKDIPVQEESHGQPSQGSFIIIISTF